MCALRILLADDNDEILGAIRQELAQEFEIIGTVSNGQDAVDAVLLFDPDVVVLDIAMPILNGIQASSRYSRVQWANETSYSNHPGKQCICLSSVRCRRLWLRHETKAPNRPRLCEPPSGRGSYVPFTFV